MRRAIVDTTTRLLGWLKRGQRVRLSDEGKPIKVNLGAGLAVAPGWVNVDGSLNALVASWPKLFHRIIYRLTGASAYYTFEQYHGILCQNRFAHHDLAYGVPFADNSVDCVFTSHFLEHLPKQIGAHLLGNIYRALKPGGRVRIAVPDLAFAISLYRRDEKLRMLDNYFFVDHDGSYFARHKYMYDYELLKVVLSQIGFVDIERCAYREGKIPDIGLLDNRPEDSLFVEAVKPLSGSSEKP